MNRQSRAVRWLSILENTEAFVESTLQSLRAYRSRGSDIPPDGRVLLVRQSSDSIKLAAEADPPIAGTPLAAHLDRIIERAQNLDTAADFEPSLRSLLEAIEAVLPALRVTVVDEVASAKDIVDELERSFIVSLTVSMTAHTTAVKWVTEWEEAHRKYLAGRGPEIGHYRAMRPTNIDPEDPYAWPIREPNFWADEPGPGRLHVQHLIAAIYSGTNLMVAGAESRSIEHYPELQTIQYGEWFAYIHAVWEEQFRQQLADFWSRGLPVDEPPFKVNEIINDFFGDLRLIRNDFVHNKGEVNESVNLKSLGWELVLGEPIRIEVERMIELMERFPRDELLKRPDRQPEPEPSDNQKRTNMPGSGRVDLIDEFLEIVKRNQFNKKRAVDQMIEDWIEKHQVRIDDPD